MTRLPARSFAIFFAVALVTSQPGCAYEIPLESHSVRDGYFFGQRGDEKLFRFIDTYTKHLPVPQKGPYISEIKLFTPYAQVVDISRQKTAGYSAQQAAQEYKDRGDTFRVYVRIEFTATYGFIQAVESANHAAREQKLELQPQEFWRDFQYILSQDAKPAESHDSTPDSTTHREEQEGDRRIMDARSADYTPIYSNNDYNGGLAGAVVWLDYDAKDINSDPASVEVVTPGGQHVVATFDLAKLR
jgi:hypothetical protein